MFLDVIDELRRAGAQGVVLGCTEIPLLVRPQDCNLPLFNTTLLHAEKALNYATGSPGGHHG
jgi:aspartate racemase